MSVFTGGPYGRLAIMLNTLSSLNIEIIIIIIIIGSKVEDSTDTMCCDTLRAAS